MLIYLVLFALASVLRITSCLEIFEKLLSVWGKRRTLYSRILEQYLLHRFKILLLLHLFVLGDRICSAFVAQKVKLFAEFLRSAFYFDVAKLVYLDCKINIRVLILLWLKLLHDEIISEL